jgi:glycosyltransferase involved in cell wall biosynthesis
LLAGEKYMYKKADAIVMTWEGGPTYISEMGWDSEIPLTKISHICNGVSLKEFKYNAEAFSYEDEDLEDTEAFKVVYTGAIRHVNKVDMLVDVADIIAKKGNPNKVKILIWGDGDKADEIKKRIKERDLDNIVMKGKVSKQYIPSILSQGDCSLLHNASTSLDRFGHSQNKFFEYLAAEKPILMTYAVGYSIIQKYNCGIQLDEQNAENIASCIDKLAELSSDKKEILAKNASIAAEEYDYSKLTKKLISIMESL